MTKKRESVHIVWTCSKRSNGCISRGGGMLESEGTPSPDKGKAKKGR